MNQTEIFLKILIKITRLCLRQQDFKIDATFKEILLLNQCYPATVSLTLTLTRQDSCWVYGNRITSLAPVILLASAFGFGAWVVSQMF